MLCSDGWGVSPTSGDCVKCAIGKYANHSKNDPHSDCQLCPAGAITNQMGSVECTTCPTGKLSSDDRTQGDDCKAGQHTLNDEVCADCAFGK